MKVPIKYFYFINKLENNVTMYNLYKNSKNLEMDKYIKTFDNINLINNFLNNYRKSKNCFVVLPFALNRSQTDLSNNFYNICEKFDCNDASVITEIESETIVTIFLQKSGRTKYLDNFNNFNNLLNSAIECISFDNYIGAISILALMIEPLEKLSNKYLNNNFEKKINESLFDFIFYNIPIEDNGKNLFLNSKIGKINYLNISDDTEMIYTQVEKFCNENNYWLKHKQTLERYFMHLKFISIFFKSSNSLKEVFWSNQNNDKYCEYFNRNKIAHTFSFFNHTHNKIMQYKITAGLICLINYFTEVLFIGEGFYSKNGISILGDKSKILPSESISKENYSGFKEEKRKFNQNQKYVLTKKTLLWKRRLRILLRSLFIIIILQLLWILFMILKDK